MPGSASTSVQETDRLLQSAIHRLRAACDVDLVFAGPRNLGAHDSITIRHLDGNLGQSLRHLTVRAGSGLGGKALALGRPVVVQDYFNAREIVHAYDRAVAPERVQTALAVPVRLQGSPVGLLYLALRANVAIGDRTVDRAVSAVRRLEQDLAIDQEVRRRVAAQVEHAATPAYALDDLHQELQAAIALVGDAAAQQRLQQVSDRLRRLAAGAEMSVSSSPLSARELDVVQLLARGATNNEIAADLGLRPNTVKAYLRSVARKLGAENRTHAVVLAREMKLID